MREAVTVRPDVLTLIAIAVLAYAIADVAHEGVGHGGACLLVGCKPHLLTTMQFDGDASQLPPSASRIIAAGGSIVNLLLAGIGALLLRRASIDRPRTWLFLWLLTSVSLFQATGYLLFSGVGNVGDWVVVTEGLPGGIAWKFGLIAIGGLSYWLAVRWSMRRLGVHLREQSPSRAREAYRYTLTVYLTGAVLAIVAGMFDPLAQAIILISGVAASMGGTSGLAWGPQLLRDPKFAPTLQPLAVLQRDWRWIVLGLVTAAVFVLVLGPGLRF
jgi:hypothetical protein